MLAPGEATRRTGRSPVKFIEERALLFHRDQTLARHSNGMRFRACGESDQPIAEREFYELPDKSRDGDFVVVI
jgi:hypothetical protein